MAEQIITLGIGATPATLTPFITSGLEIGEAVVIVGVDTGLFLSVPSLRVRGRNHETVPYLTDEGGAILTDESGVPLISNAQVTRLLIVPPTLRIKERR